MQSRRLREQLTLKPVGLEHLDQYNELYRYVFQVTNEDLTQGGYEEGELSRAKRAVLDRADVIGWFNKDDNLISQVCVVPGTVNIHGKLFTMGGLTGVGTYPEYAGLGLMHDLIKHALERMRERRQLVSYLFPYSIPFYRKKGWEIISDTITYEVEDSQLPKKVEVPGYVERVCSTHEDIINTYNMFARQNHGAMLREPLDWEEYWRWENEEERNGAVYYTQDGKPTGFIIYWIYNDVFNIKEFVYINHEAQLGLWNFISAHISMVDSVTGHMYKNEPVAFIMGDSQIKESIEPYYMGRIVDVFAFLQAFPFIRINKPLHFEITDPMADWNNGVFGLAPSGTSYTVTREACGGKVQIDIGTLMSLLMNYRRPAYFAAIERLKTDGHTLEILENIIPDNTPYFSDYF